MLKLVLPKGSLERATLELFEAADLPVQRSSSVDYQASIDDPRIESVRILRPQEIPTDVAGELPATATTIWIGLFVFFEYLNSPRLSTTLPVSSTQSRPVIPRSKRPSDT